METVVNPQTGRQIKTTGRTYTRLFPTGKMWLDSQSQNPELRANANWYLEAATNPEKFGFKSLRGVRMSRTYDLNHTTPKKKGMTTLIDNPDRYANNPHLFDFPNVDNGDKIRKLPKWIRDRMAQQRKILYSELWAYIDRKYPLLSKEEKQEIVSEYNKLIKGATKAPKPTQIPKPDPQSKKIDVAKLALGSKLKQPTIISKMDKTTTPPGMTDHQKRMAILDAKIAAVKEYRKNKIGYENLKKELDAPETTPPGFAVIAPTTTLLSDVDPNTTPPGYKITLTKANKKIVEPPVKYVPWYDRPDPPRTLREQENDEAIERMSREARERRKAKLAKRL